MKLGVNPWTVYGWDLPEAITGDLAHHLAPLGCQGLELVLDEAHNSRDLLLARQPELSAQTQDLGMEIPSVASALFWRHNLASQNEAVRARGLDTIRAGCQVAHAYGARVFLEPVQDL